MKSLFVAIILVFVSFSSASHAQDAPNFEGSEIKEVLRQYDEAWNRKDVKGVSDLLDDSYVYFSSVGTLSTKKPTLEFLAKPGYKLTSVSRTDHKLHSNDGKVAVVSSRWQGKGSWSGGEINDDQRCGQVFTKRSGKWKLLSEHCVQIVSK